MTQKTTTLSRRDHGDVQDGQPAPERDERSRQVSEDTETLLEQIDCCLAEVEADARQAEKDRAKAEWETLPEINHHDDYDEYRRQRQIWIVKYQHLFEWCCGEPVFD